MSLIEALDVWFSTKYFLYTFFMLPSMAHGTYRRREARMRRKDTIIYKCIGTTSRRRRGSGGGYAVLYQSAQGARRPPGGGSSTSMTYRRRTTSTSFLVDLVAYLQCVYPLSREVVVLLCPDLWYQKHLLPWWRSSYRLVTYSSSYLNIYFLGIVLHSGK